MIWRTTGNIISLREKQENVVELKITKLKAPVRLALAILSIASACASGNTDNNSGQPKTCGCPTFFNLECLSPAIIKNPSSDVVVTTKVTIRDATIADDETISRFNTPTLPSIVSFTTSIGEVSFKVKSHPAIPRPTTPDQGIQRQPITPDQRIRHQPTTPVYVTPRQLASLNASQFMTPQINRRYSASSSQLPFSRTGDVLATPDGSSRNSFCPQSSDLRSFRRYFSRSSNSQLPFGKLEDIFATPSRLLQHAFGTPSANHGYISPDSTPMKNPNRLEEVLSDDDAFLQSINFPTERSPSPNMVSPDPDTPKKKKRKKGNDDNNCSGDKKRKKDNDDNNNSDSKRFKRS